MSSQVMEDVKTESPSSNLIKNSSYCTLACITPLWSLSSRNKHKCSQMHQRQFALTAVVVAHFNERNLIPLGRI